MNIKQYNARLKKFIQEIEKTKPVFLAVSNVVREQSIRVFENGGVESGGAKGSYTGGALYVNPKTAPRSRGLKLQGKNGGKSKFKNGNPRKTAYFASYAAYKLALGKKAYPNLVLFGNLEKAFGASIKEKKSGDTITITQGIRIDLSNPIGKINGLIEKYPFAFKPTEQEKQMYYDDLAVYLADARKASGL